MDKQTSRSITILHLYPREMSIYGDFGNVRTLQKRLEWRGFEVKVLYADVGEKPPITEADIIFAGGGQDKSQLAVGQDLAKHAKALHQASADGVPILAICGTYQLFGHQFTTLEGKIIPGIGLFDAETVGSTKRMIGNIVLDSEFGEIVGFENHSGQTKLATNQTSFGRVKKGFGNDSSSGQEGARVNNTFGTYLHGPILPKNPAFADYLLQTALNNKYGINKLEPLDDQLEHQAHISAARRPQ